MLTCIILNYTILHYSYILAIPGTDPAADLYKFAEEMKFLKKLTAISLGQGQVQLTCKIHSHCYTCVYMYIVGSDS